MPAGTAPTRARTGTPSRTAAATHATRPARPASRRRRTGRRPSCAADRLAERRAEPERREHAARLADRVVAAAGQEQREERQDERPEPVDERAAPQRPELAR